MLRLLLVSHPHNVIPPLTLLLALQLSHMLLPDLLHFPHVRLLLCLGNIPLLLLTPSLSLLLLLLLLLSLLLRRRRTAGIEPARDGGIAPHLPWHAHSHPRIAPLLGAGRAGGVGVPRVRRLGGGGLRLAAAPGAGVLRAGRVPPRAAAEGVVVLVVRVVGHAGRRGALGLVAAGLAAQVERVGLLLLLLLAGAGGGPGVVLLLMREGAAHGRLGLDAAVLRAPCGLGRDGLCCLGRRLVRWRPSGL